MQAATVEKTLATVKKSFTLLPMASDLPRLTNSRVFDHNKEVFLENPSTATTTDRLLWIFEQLALLLLGPQAKQDIETKFKAAGFSEESMASVTLAKTQVNDFLAAIGGDESPIVNIMKSVNQAAIASAVIELKMVLTLENMTKDVRNTWTYSINFKDDVVSVISQRREQCLKNNFQMEWELLFNFDRANKGACKEVKLAVTDLLFHADLHLKPEKAAKKEDIKRLLKPYCSPEVLAASDTKTWEFYTPDDAAKRPGATPATTNSAAADSNTPAVSGPSADVETKKISTTYPNGDKYDGEVAVKSGQRYGRGVYHASGNEYFYDGQYKDGLRHGTGVYRLKSGAKYEGSFEKGNFIGGTFTFPNNDQYSGGFVEGAFSGKGRFTRGDGTESYDGTFKAGQRNGMGTAILNKTDRYEGSWINDAMQGPGKYTYANGDTFTGTFREGKPHGVGEYRFTAQKKVEFKEGKLSNVHSVKEFS